MQQLPHRLLSTQVRARAAWADELPWRARGTRAANCPGRRRTDFFRCCGLEPLEDQEAVKQGLPAVEARERVPAELLRRALERARARARRVHRRVARARRPAMGCRESAFKRGRASVVNHTCV